MNIPLGYETIFLITPSAREIDDTVGNELTESQRNCRLDEDTDELEVFNVYTRVSCLLECKMKYAMERCGCIPWNYPLNMKKKVSSFK